MAHTNYNGEIRLEVGDYFIQKSPSGIMEEYEVTEVDTDEDELVARRGDGLSATWNLRELEDAVTEGTMDDGYKYRVSNESEVRDYDKGGEE